MNPHESPAQILHRWKMGASLAPCFQYTALKLRSNEEGLLLRVIERLETSEPGSGCRLLLHGVVSPSPTALLSQLLRQCEETRQPTSRTTEEADFLTHLIKVGIQAKQFSACPPPERVLPKRVQHLIQPDCIDGSRRAALWHATLIGSFALDLTEQERFGRYLACLCLRNGVVSAKLLNALAKASADQILNTRNLYYLEILHQSHVMSRTSIRRVFLEPLSAIIAIRDGALFAGAATPELWRAINSFFKAAQAEEPPASLGAFMRDCRGYLALRLPGYILPYADGSMPSTSVPERIFRRTQGIAERSSPVVRHSVADLQDISEDAAAKEPASESSSIASIEAIMASVTESVGTEDLCKALEQLHQDANLSQTPRGLGIVALWGLSMMKSDKTPGLRRAAPAIRTALLTVGVALAEYLGESGPEDLDADDLTEIQESLAEYLVPRVDRSKRYHDLNDLMSFLSRIVEAGGDPSRWRKKIVVPDAAYLTPGEVLDLLRLLGDPSRNIDDSAERLLCQALAAGLSMGTRPKEWIKIYLEHVFYDRAIVKVTKDRSLKTASAQRYLCFALGLPEAEKSIRALLAARRQEECKHPHSAFLHALPGQTHVYSDTRIERNIESALKEVTGERSTRMYHLRHSMASWLFLAVASRINELEATLRPLLGDLGAVLDHVDRWISVVAEYPNAQATPLYAIARALGQSNFNVTREHYVHTFDVVMLALLMKSVFPVEWPQLAAASGLPRSSSRAGRYSDSWALVAAVEHRYPGRTLREDTPLVRELPAAYSTKLFPHLVSIHDQLALDLTSDSDIVPALDFRRIQQRALSLSKLASDKRGSKAPRHPMSRSVNGLPRPLDFSEEAIRTDARIACRHFEIAIEANIEEVAWAVGRYVDSAQSRHPRISFGDRLDAIRFARVFGLMGVSRKMIEWGYGLKTCRGDISAARNSGRKRLWVSYVPTLGDSGYRPVSGWRWGWQMLACTIDAKTCWTSARNSRANLQ